MSGLSGSDLAQLYLNQQNLNRAQQNYGYLQNMGQPTQFGNNTGVSNLGGALASMLFKPQAQQNLQAAQGQQAQLLGSALSNNASAAPAAPQTTGGPMPTQPAPQQQSSAGGPGGPVIASFAPNVGKSSSSGGGGMGSMLGGMMGGSSSASTGGMGSMMGGMGGGQSGGGSSQQNQYTPAPPSFTAHINAPSPAQSGALPGGYAQGQTAIHPGTGQQIVFRDGAWTPT